MAMNRVQFQRGTSLAVFLERYGSEEQCETALVKQRWGAGFCCDRCTANGFRSFRRGSLLYRECVDCGRQISLLVGTLFEHTRLSLTKWFLALYLLTQSKTNMAALELGRHMDVCYRTAWRVKHKVLKAMENEESARQLEGIVLLDDAYLGGEQNGGKVGRGSENKVPFLMAVSLSDDGRPLHVVASRVEGFTKQAVSQWAQTHLTGDCEIYSDGLNCFPVVSDLGHAHTVVKAKGRAATQTEPMRWLNVVLSNLKRSIDGTYHSVRFRKYTQRYLAEAMWRFNRRFNLSAILAQLIANCVQSKPWTEARLRSEKLAY